MKICPVNVIHQIKMQTLVQEESIVCYEGYVRNRKILVQKE